MGILGNSERFKLNKYPRAMNEWKVMKCKMKDLRVLKLGKNKKAKDKRRREKR
jgi:hypothetical protein